MIDAPFPIRYTYDMNTESLTELSGIRALVESGAAKPIRLAARLSLNEVARSVGVSPATVLRWENRERVPHGDAAVAYGRLLRALMAQQGRRQKAPS